MHISAMAQKLAFFAFEGFQLLDLTGPASVYAAANALLGCEAYTMRTVSRASGSVRSSAGLAIDCLGIIDMAPADVDALFLVGGDLPEIGRVIADSAMREWANAAAVSASRYGSICSGSVLLAAWGMIGARRFATHWSAVPHIRKRWPTLNLDAESIFVEDDGLWTSAGVTAGIDMTLAIVERDHGPEIARAIAQRLVLSVRRPGWQSQFNPVLAAQSGRSGRYAELVAWISGHLHKPMTVELLADRAGETLRSFHRNFTAATGVPPAGFITRQRVDRARAMIAEGQPLKTVARHCGYADVARLSSAFRKTMGMSAAEYRVVHARPA
jgi:transcriptional regulator GlxA family with amidase domain